MNRSKENRKSFQTRPTIWLWPILLVAAYFRLSELGIKPPHFDEGINGHFVLTLWRDGYYTYDPSNFHGPLYFYLLHLSEIIFGRGVESFRIMNAFLSIGLVALLFQFRRFVGGAAVWAAAMVAISPAFTFYGRYAIHETLFIIGQVAFVYGRLIWMQRPRREAIYFMTAGLVVLLATKETFFIFVGTWFIAELVVFLSERLQVWIALRRAQGSATDFPTERPAPWSRLGELSSLEMQGLIRAAWLSASLAVLVILALFTGFFENPKGAGDFIRAFDFWSKTGNDGNGHGKEMAYWLKTLWRYEWLMCLGLAVSAVSALPLRWVNRSQRILLLTGFGSFLAYSIIHYKTPWLLLSFWSLFFFMVPLLRRGVWQLVIIALLVAGFGHDARQAWSLNFHKYADSSEPYVYVQTTSDYTKVMEVLNRKIKLSPDTKNSVLLIMVQDPWPLPYDVALFPNLKYTKLEDIDRNLDLLKEADMILIDGSHLEGLRKVFPKKFARMKFQLRDAYESGWALFDFEKFQSVLAGDVELEEPQR